MKKLKTLLLSIQPVRWLCEYTDRPTVRNVGILIGLLLWATVIGIVIGEILKRML